jgi:hypothetical protein
MTPEEYLARMQRDVRVYVYPVRWFERAVVAGWVLLAIAMFLVGAFAVK